MSGMKQIAAALTLSISYVVCAAPVNSGRDTNQNIDLPPIDIEGKMGNPKPKPSDTKKGQRRDNEAGDTTTKTTSDPLNPFFFILTFPVMKDFYINWVNNQINQLWRPSVIFLAETAKGEAYEEVAKSLADISFTYLTGHGWEVRTAAKWTTTAISTTFKVLDAIWPSEIAPEPTPKELNDLLIRLEMQRQKENLQETKKRSPQSVSPFLKTPSGSDSKRNEQAEERRRRAIFSRKDLSQDEAKDVLVKGVTIVHGPSGGRFFSNMLWLFDAERIERDGLSQDAEDLFLEMLELAEEMRKKRLSIDNACVVRIPYGNAISTTYACSLKSGKYRACYCPPPPNYLGPAVEGIPASLPTGQVCFVQQNTVCPLVNSVIVGSYCSCNGLSGTVKR